MSKYVKLAAAAALAIGLSFGFAAAPAKALTFNLDREFSGATDPAGPTPWVVAEFSTIAGGVQLKLSTPGLVDDEFMSRFYFNIDPFLTPVTFAHVSGVMAAPTGNLAAWNFDEDDHRADGDGDFDVRGNYPTSGDIFGANMESVYNFFHEDLTLAHIEALSAGAGNSPDGLFVAAHIQGINGASGWITGDPGDPSVVPLPAGLLLFLTGLAGVGFLGRYNAKRRREPELV